MAASSLHILYKAPLEKTGYTGKPYFSLLVAYASRFLIRPSTVAQGYLWLPTPCCAASVCLNEALYCITGTLPALSSGVGGDRGNFRWGFYTMIVIYHGISYHAIT